MCTDIHLPIGCPVPTHPIITHLTVATIVDLCDGTSRGTMYLEPERRAEVASRCPYCVHAAAHAAAAALVALSASTATNNNIITTNNNINNNNNSIENNNIIENNNTIDNNNLEAFALSPGFGPFSVPIDIDGGALTDGNDGVGVGGVGDMDFDFDLDANAFSILDVQMAAAAMGGGGGGGGDLGMNLGMDLDINANSMLTLNAYETNYNLMPTLSQPHTLNQPWFGGLETQGQGQGQGQGQQMQTVDFSSLAGGEVVMHNSIPYDTSANIGPLGPEADSEELMRQMLDAIDFNNIDWEALLMEFPGLNEVLREDNNQS